MSDDYKPGPASVFSILARQEEKCCCFEYIGDNENCPVHITRFVMKDGRRVRTVVKNAKLTMEEENHAGKS